mmetsp:Transcript_16936/g.33935  ORF Transcript_16936/g.33935 Transcript_16936/m.33935 type:complete len:240 (-) Transcript_16936:384-1103(-)
MMRATSRFTKSSESLLNSPARMRCCTASEALRAARKSEVSCRAACAACTSSALRDAWKSSIVFPRRLTFMLRFQTRIRPLSEYRYVEGPTTSKQEFGGNRNSFSPGNKLRKSIDAPRSTSPTLIINICLCGLSGCRYPIACSMSVLVLMKPISQPTRAPNSLGVRNLSDILIPAIPRMTRPPSGRFVTRAILISAEKMTCTVVTNVKDPRSFFASLTASSNAFSVSPSSRLCCSTFCPS